METDNVLFRFAVPDKLPGLNEYTDACRSHWSKGYRMKKDAEELIGWAIATARRKQRAKPITVPCVVYIVWHEGSRARDVDNIQSAQKFIMDALKNSGMIRDDNRRWVKQIYHKVVDDDRWYSEIRLEVA